MATVSNNPLVEGLRGKVGGLVFRRVQGKTIVSKVPCSASDESVLQRATRDRFRMASAWAKEQLRDVEKRKWYKALALRKKLPNAYTAALQEFMKQPMKETTKPQASQVASDTPASVAVSARPVVLYFDSPELRMQEVASCGDQNPGALSPELLCFMRSLE